MKAYNYPMLIRTHNLSSSSTQLNQFCVYTCYVSQNENVLFPRCTRAPHPWGSVTLKATATCSRPQARPEPSGKSRPCWRKLATLWEQTPPPSHTLCLALMWHVKCMVFNAATAPVLCVLQLVPYSPLKIKHVVEELMIKGVLADGATTMLQKLWVEMSFKKSVVSINRLIILLNVHSCSVQSSNM